MASGSSVVYLQFFHAPTELRDIAHQLEAASHCGQHISNLWHVPAGKSTLNALKQLRQLGCLLQQKPWA